MGPSLVLLERDYGVSPKKTTAMVQLVMNAPFKKIAPDAHSLRLWLRALFVALHRKPPSWL